MTHKLRERVESMFIAIFVAITVFVVFAIDFGAELLYLRFRLFVLGF